MKPQVVSEHLTSDEKLHEAMSLLNDAAHEKRDELTALLDERYSDLKTVLVDAVQRSTDRVQRAGMAVAAKAKATASATNASVHESPWTYIGGAAAGGLLLGYLLGRRQ